MTIVFALVALAVIGTVAVLAAGKIGQLDDPVVDRFRPELPLAPLSATDVAQMRFGTGVRGYRMDDVDDALVRLSETLRIREAQLAALSPASDLDGSEAQAVSTVQS